MSELPSRDGAENAAAVPSDPPAYGRALDPASGSPAAGAAGARPAARPAGFSDLGDVVAHPDFPGVDQALRRGRHIHAEDESWYAFLLEAQRWLEDFYRRYGCELVQRSDGYFFLLPVSEGFGKRHLSIGEMIVGQGLALAYLDPRSMEHGRVIRREELLSQLASVMGESALMSAFNPKRKRLDERVMQRNVRQKVAEALRRLAQLGFVELLDDDRLRLPPSLMRFAEPVRGLEAPSEALAKLIERGEIAISPVDGEDDATRDEGASDDAGSDEPAGQDAGPQDASEDELEELAGAEDSTIDPGDGESSAISDLPPEHEGGFDLDWDTLPSEEP